VFPDAYRLIAPDDDALPPVLLPPLLPASDLSLRVYRADAGEVRAVF
jgi:hypothetical protein